MRREDFVPIQSQVGTFLAAHGGVVHGADVGPLIGYAAWLLECRAVDEPLPAGWREALSAALADPATNGPMPGSYAATACAGPTATPPVPGIAAMHGAVVTAALH